MGNSHTSHSMITAPSLWNHMSPDPKPQTLSLYTTDLDSVCHSMFKLTYWMENHTTPSFTLKGDNFECAMFLDVSGRTSLMLVEEGVTSPSTLKLKWNVITGRVTAKYQKPHITDSKDTICIMLHLCPASHNRK